MPKKYQQKYTQEIDLFSQVYLNESLQASVEQPSQVNAETIHEESGRIYAKSKLDSDGRAITLARHYQDMLCILYHFQNMADPVVREILKIAIVAHDLGKATSRYQKLFGNTSWNTANDDLRLDHSLLSLLFVNEKKLEKLYDKIVSIKPNIKLLKKHLYKVLYIAILYHHYRKDFISIITTGHGKGVPNVVLRDFLQFEQHQETILDRVRKELEHIDSGLLAPDISDFIGSNERIISGIKNGLKLIDYAPLPYTLLSSLYRGAPDKDFEYYAILTSGFLQLIDHIASYIEGMPDYSTLNNIEVYLPPMIYPHPVSDIERRFLEKINAIGTGNSNVWQLQYVGDVRDRNTVVIAPTGYGKTEFSFLWATGSRFFYVLPLRAAVNMIYERTKNMFGEEYTGLLHSDADLYYLHSAKGTEFEESMRMYNFAKQLLLPCLVATMDQLFVYSLRPPGYERVYAAASIAKTIVDEIQSCDPRAAAIATKFIKDIVKLGGQFLVMTATLPSFIRKEIEKIDGKQAFNVINIYEMNKEKLHSIKKHAVQVISIDNTAQKSKKDAFDIPDDQIEKICNLALREGKRVLVIANTVQQAQYLYKKIKEKSKYDKVFLLHSRFTLSDRRRIESKMMEEFRNPKSDQKGKILVSTQVVEASLDIDADVLFTEVAPIDSLIQRMGRVLRRYGPSSPYTPEATEPNVYVWVFKKDYQSGKANVYDTALILATIRILGYLSNKLPINLEEITQYIEMKSNPNSHKDKKDNSKNKEQKDSAENKNQEDSTDNEEQINIAKNKETVDQKKSNDQQNKPAIQAPIVQEIELSDAMFILSEYDKYLLCCYLYDALPENSSYLSRFRDTLCLLEANYVVENKDKAQELFRHISTLPMVPKDYLNKLINDLNQFVHNSKYFNYTEFKDRILSNYVVDVRGYKSEINTVSEVIAENTVIKNLEIKYKDKTRKLIKWLKDIYVGDFKYDSEIGASKRRESDDWEE